MGKFNPPWASVGGVVRSPTNDEQNDGFSCGGADLTLFNRLFQRYDAEIQAVLEEGGITGTEEDDTALLQAILAIIAAATGGGDTSQFVLFSQAQARLPIYPEVTTNNGVIAVTTPGTGQVRIPAGAVVMHRGIRPYTTVQADLSTVASKTYHLRWTPTGGTAGTFVLKDLADVAYNPTVAAESNVAFDSSYDDMLVARVTVNSSNVITEIRTLVNQHQLTRQTIIQGVAENTPNLNNSRFRATDTFNWARRPTSYALHPVNVQYVSTSVDDWDYIMVPGGADPEVTASSFDITRYRIDQSILVDFAANAHFSFSGRA